MQAAFLKHKPRAAAYPALRSRNPINIPTPATNIAHVDGSGTTSMVKESAVAPEPHVQMYVPGVIPRLPHVASVHVALPDKKVPEV